MRYAFINEQRTTAPQGAVAYKYTDPTEEARWIYDSEEAWDIASEDPTLIAWTEEIVTVHIAYDTEKHAVERVLADLHKEARDNPNWKGANFGIEYDDQTSIDCEDELKGAQLLHDVVYPAIWGE